jgi:hypothetical protein
VTFLISKFGGFKLGKFGGFIGKFGGFIGKFGGFW